MNIDEEYIDKIYILSLIENNGDIWNNFHNKCIIKSRKDYDCNLNELTILKMIADEKYSDIEFDLFLKYDKETVDNVTNDIFILIYHIDDIIKFIFIKLEKTKKINISTINKFNISKRINFNIDYDYKVYYMEDGDLLKVANEHPTILKLIFEFYVWDNNNKKILINTIDQYYY